MDIKICESLRKARKNCGYTMPQVTELLLQAGCSASKSSVSRWEMGHSNPSIDQFIALCRIYHIRDVVKTFCDGEIKPFFAELNDAGRQKLDEYRLLLIASCQYRPEGNVIPFPSRRIMHFIIPASAGYGVFLDSEEYVEVEVGQEVPLSATFGVSISGDSMEPELHDGNSVWVHRQQTLDDGEIGLFMLNEKAFVKKLSADKDGIRLLSLNPAYPPMCIDDGDTLRVLGKVVANTPKPQGID